ncbi:ABC transporter ATP-binding protein [Ferroacidibacillus organovorans]|uniref:Lipid A ABC transporter permease/ATP-binding protein n=1 Tax=Ferroacidibacillus organovorans TaxID=1765683 RepID=A0A124IW88_9BACL|nr:ABC transporter ATP-binding protein [Ferroacidibacillus organovorans]KUO96661.1 hypothetical protein ATW55_07480 [Ferroacidibacillus organovorans]
MSNLHEEDSLGKAYDAKLMKRLIGYARPHRFWVALCVLLLLVMTVSNLARPYLMKIAIDNHMTAFSQPMMQVSKTQPNVVLTVHGASYARVQDLPTSTKVSGTLYELLPIGQRTALIAAPAKEFYTAGHLAPLFGTPTISHNAVRIGNTTYPTSWIARKNLASVYRYDQTGMLWLGGIYLALILFGGILNYIQTYILQWTVQRIIFRIRTDIFTHVQGLSIAFFDRNPVGRLVTRVMNDTQTLNDMYANLMVNVFNDLFLLIGIILVMLNLNVKLALIAFVAIPLIAIASIIYRRVARESYRQVRVRLARINAMLAENLSGMRIIQIFHREVPMFQNFLAINQDHLNASWRELKANAVFRPSMDLIEDLTLALLIWFGGGAAISHTVNFGTLYAIITYVGQFFQPINDMTEKYNILQSAMASSERIFLLLDTEERIEEPLNPVALPKMRGEIEFDHVWFAYQGEDWVLRDVSFHVSPGQTVAFVGATGAGKSSILNILSRLYEIQKGSIRIDGIDIRTLPLATLRSHVAMVLQDVFLFTGDIASNIRLNREDLSDQAIEKVLKQVNAGPFIEALPLGIHEPVMERGATLSYGQRQLIAFARALAFDPRILVLDEATANIDTETEIVIQDALTNLMKDRTTLVVAHRLSTIQHADQIIVLHKGKIREHGTHQQLLQTGGLYQTLYELQYKDQWDSGVSTELVHEA